MLIETMDAVGIETRLQALRELLVIAEHGVAGQYGAVNDGWSVAEHIGYAQALRDAISIVETGR